MGVHQVTESLGLPGNHMHTSDREKLYFVRCSEGGIVREDRLV